MPHISTAWNKSLLSMKHFEISIIFAVSLPCYTFQAGCSRYFIAPTTSKNCPYYFSIKSQLFFVCLCNCGLSPCKLVTTKKEIIGFYNHALLLPMLGNFIPGNDGATSFFCLLSHLVLADCDSILEFDHVEEVVWREPALLGVVKVLAAPLQLLDEFLVLRVGFGLLGQDLAYGRNSKVHVGHSGLNYNSSI